MAACLVQQMSMRSAATAQLAQTMALLELPIADLEVRLNQELASNPALESITDEQCPQCGRRLRKPHCPVCSPVPMSADDPEICFSARPLPGEGQIPHDRDTEAFRVSGRCAPEDLLEHVMRQISPFLDRSDQSIAIYLLSSLDERGFLSEPPTDSATVLGVPLAQVERVLTLIRNADPAGVGAQNVCECLLLQLKSLESEGRGHALASAIIEKYWDALTHSDLGLVAGELAVSQVDVRIAIAFIRHNLTPYPAYANWHRDGASVCHEAVACCVPDAAIVLLSDDRGERLRIEIYKPYAGGLRVAPNFREAISNCTGQDRALWESHVRRAQQFVAATRYRGDTLGRLLRSLAQEQRQFILGGELRSMTRAQLAAQLEVHESTISRAVASKYVTMPNGRTLPLSAFFDRGVTVRQAVKHIIATERRSLADSEVAARLAEQGLQVARRTVTKYREAAGIAPASARTLARVESDAAPCASWPRRAQSSAPH